MLEGKEEVASKRSSSRMRLDLFLKTSRLVKRRGQAKALCDAGRVLVDGLPAKAGRQVRAGTRIRLDFYNRYLEVEVRQVQGVVLGRGTPPTLYTVVAERRSARRGMEENDASLYG